MKICHGCVLDEAFPRSDIDGSGLCVYCRAIAGHDPRADFKKPARAFKQFLSGIRSSAGYHAVAALSGGKDSTHLAWLLTRKHRLRVLAFTLDNGFMAAQTRQNISRVTDRLGVDHVMVRPPAGLLRGLFVRSAKRPDAHSTKALERSSAICASCIGLVKAIGLKLAAEKKAPLLCFGWTPGQSAASASFIRFEPAMLAGFQQATRGILEKICGEDLSRWFATAGELSETGRNPYWAYPAAFERYDERGIYRVICSLGWRKPRGLDPNSTNCRLNAFAVEEHRRRFGFHPYAFELAKLVREGYLLRSDAIRRLRWRAPKRLIRRIAGELKTALPED